MGRKRKDFPVLENIEILDAGSEGKSIARVEKMVVFVQYVVPGDIVDVQVLKKKKSFYEGKAIRFHHYSDKRTKPRCEHFGICGGCKWQNLNYNEQLFYKQKQVADSFTRIGKINLPEILPIIPAPEQYYYRNKLEFTFSNRKWLTVGSIGTESSNGLGFHLPGFFDKILDIENCYLQPEPSNKVRLAVKEFALKNNFEFYNNRTHTGFLRNLIIRTSTTGGIMVIMVFAREDKELIWELLGFISGTFPQVTSMMYVINTKRNDTINDLVINLFKGDSFVLEEMDGLKFKVGPLSFYQTNPIQAMKLYQVAKGFADLKGSETVFDLYCGTGTITNFIARSAGKVIGIEYIPSAIEDAMSNSALNHITNTHFITGDIAKTFGHELFGQFGNPDIIITDPPRSGMHPKVVESINLSDAGKVVYISCNPATQARDIAMMQEHYELIRMQPVDMFPQTHHVENVALLIRKDRPA